MWQAGPSLFACSMLRRPALGAGHSLHRVVGLVVLLGGATRVAVGRVCALDGCLLLYLALLG
jgi:hypothetical protein